MAWTPSLPGNYTETPTGGGNYATTATGEGFITGLDLYAPNEIVEKIYNRHRHEAGFRFMLSSSGKKVMASQPTVSHYEAGLRTDNVKVGATISGSGAGADVIVALHTDAMFTVSGISGQTSYPREGDLISLHDGKRAWVKLKNTGVNPHRITLRPTLASVDISTSLSAGDSYAIVGNAWGEGTGTPSGIQKKYWKYSSGFQIIKEGFAYTGSALSNAMRLVAPSGNTPGLPYLLEVHDDTLCRWEIATDRTLLFADEIDNITVTSNILNATVNVSGTKGLDTFARNYGHQYAYTIGSWALSDYDEMAKIYEGERIGARLLAGMFGYDYMIEVENVLQAEIQADGNQAYLLKAASALYSNDNLGGTEMDEMELRGMAVEIGFRAIHKAGYTFSWQKLSEFSNKVGFGAEGYDYRNRGIVTPVGWVNQLNMGGDSTNAPTMFYVYKGLGSYSRELQIGVINGIGSQGFGNFVDANMLLKSNMYDGTQVGFVSEIGFHMALPNGLTYITGS